MDTQVWREHSNCCNQKPFTLTGGRDTKNITFTCPMVTNIALLDAMVAPENNLTGPSSLSILYKPSMACL